MNEGEKEALMLDNMKKGQKRVRGEEEMILKRGKRRH